MVDEVPDDLLGYQLQAEYDRKGRHYVYSSPSPDSTQPPSREVVSECWRIKKRVGSGGQGSVFLQECVRGASISMIRAVKCIHCQVDPQRRYLRELETMIRFSQPKYSQYFVRLLGYYTIRNELSIVMDYLPEGDLFSYLQERPPLAELDTQHIIGQVIQGLTFMHDVGVAHRDVKPENILIQQKPSSDNPVTWWVKLADFGISKKTNATLTNVGQHPGTRQYMPPELLNDEDLPPVEADIDHRAADVWALGVMTWYTLTKLTDFRRRRAKVAKPELASEMLPSTHSISSEGLNFIIMATIYYVTERPSLSDVSSHCWITPYIPKLTFRPISFRDGSSDTSSLETPFYGGEQERSRLTADSAVVSTTQPHSVTTEPESVPSPQIDITEECDPYSTFVTALESVPPLDIATKSNFNLPSGIITQADFVPSRNVTTKGKPVPSPTATIKTDRYSFEDTLSNAQSTFGATTLLAPKQNEPMNRRNFLPAKSQDTRDSPSEKPKTAEPDTLMTMVDRRKYGERFSMVFEPSKVIVAEQEKSELPERAPLRASEVPRKGSRFSTSQAEEPISTIRSIPFALHKAAAAGRLADVQRFISLHFDLNVLDWEGCPPLHQAARHGQAAIVKVLCNAGADMSLSCRRHGHNLDIAITRGYVDVVKTLVEAGADLYTKSAFSETYLHQAVRRGFLELTQYITDQGIEVDGKTNKGRTPLHLAVIEGQEEIVKFLIGKGADSAIPDNDGITPIAAAQISHHAKIIYLLNDAKTRRWLDDFRPPQSRYASPRNSFMPQTLKLRLSFTSWCDYLGNDEDSKLFALLTSSKTTGGEGAYWILNSGSTKRSLILAASLIANGREGRPSKGRYLIDSLDNVILLAASDGNHRVSSIILRAGLSPDEQQVIHRFQMPFLVLPDTEPSTKLAETATQDFEWRCGRLPNDKALYQLKGNPDPDHSGGLNMSQARNVHGSPLATYSGSNNKSSVFFEIQFQRAVTPRAKLIALSTAVTLWRLEAFSPNSHNLVKRFLGR